MATDSPITATAQTRVPPSRCAKRMIIPTGSLRTPASVGTSIIEANQVNSTIQAVIANQTWMMEAAILRTEAPLLHIRTDIIALIRQRLIATTAKKERSTCLLSVGRDSRQRLVHKGQPGIRLLRAEYHRRQKAKHLIAHRVDEQTKISAYFLNANRLGLR